METRPCLHLVPYWGTIVPKMSTLTENSNPSATLFGKTRRAVLSLLYGRTDEAFYIRYILRVANAGHGAVQRELKQLTDAGIIRRTVQGRQVYYQANPDTPIFEELKSLVNRSYARDSVPDTIPSQGAATASTGRAGQRIAVPRRRIASFCRRHYIARLAFFGSVLRNDFRPDSDVDVLVEFEPGYVPGFAIVAMENELSRILGRKVDLRTPADLSRYFREQVVREAQVQYAAK